MPFDHRDGFGYFFLIGGLVGLAGGVEGLARHVARCRRAVRVEATVRKVRIETSFGDEDGSHDRAYPTVSFEADGHRIVAELSGFLDPGDVRRGQKVMIY